MFERYALAATRVDPGDGVATQAPALDRSMKVNAQRELICLDEIDRDEQISQRKLAVRLGVALGLTNAIVKRLIKKGYLKITTLPRNRIKYILTPAGMIAKSRLSYEFLRYSISYITDIRTKYALIFQRLAREGATRIILYGAGEGAEIAFLCLQEYPLKLVGIVDDQHVGQRCVGHRVMPLDRLLVVQFDSPVITRLDALRQSRERLLAEGIAADRIAKM